MHTPPLELRCSLDGMVPWTSEKKVNSGCWVFYSNEIRLAAWGYSDLLYPESAKFPWDTLKAITLSSMCRWSSRSPPFCRASQPCANTNTQTAGGLHGLNLANSGVRCSGLSIYLLLQLPREEVSKLLHRATGCPAFNLAMSI